MEAETQQAAACADLLLTVCQLWPAHRHLRSWPYMTSLPRSYPIPSPGVCLFLPFRPPALQLAQRVLATVQQQASPVEAVEVDGGDVAELGGNGRNSAQEHHLQLVPGNKWRACVWEWSGWVGEDKMCRSAAGLCHGKLVWQQLTASLHKTVATVSYSF